MCKLIYSLFISTSFCFGQTLSIESGSFIIVNSNSSVSVDGLELSPSVSHTITGPNSIARSTTPIVVGDNSSIERVYELSNELTNYSGLLSFRYLNSELNGIAEAELVLEVLDANDVWSNVAPTIDDVNNILSYDFTELAGFKKVTASASSATTNIYGFLHAQTLTTTGSNAITQVQVSSVTMTQGDYLYSVVNQYGSSTSSSTNRINNYGQIGSGNLFVNKNGKIISY